MSPVLTQEPSSARLRARPLVLVVIAAAAVLGIAAFVFSALGGPGFVDRLSVTNPTDSTLDVEVREAGSAAGLPLGVVPPSTTRVFERIADQGDRWELLFFEAGAPAGTLVLSRSELEQREWKVQAPRD